MPYQRPAQGEEWYQKSVGRMAGGTTWNLGGREITVEEPTIVATRQEVFFTEGQIERIRMEYLSFLKLSEDSSWRKIIDTYDLYEVFDPDSIQNVTDEQSTILAHMRARTPNERRIV